METQATVLNITHTDLDGVVSAIVVNNVCGPENVINKYVSYGYGLDKLFEEMRQNPMSLNQYTHIIMTDISMDEDKYHELVKIFAMGDYQGTFMWFDHHETSLPNHDPMNNVYIDKTMCGASLTKHMLEYFYKIDLSYLDELVKLTEDYDLWIHKYKESKLLNYLLSYTTNTADSLEQGLAAFAKRFHNGFQYNNLNKEDYEHMLLFVDANNKVWEELEILGDGKVAVVYLDGAYISEMASRILKEFDKELVICVTPNYSLSFRTSSETLNLGNELARLSKVLPIEGGGHAKAAGGKITSIHWKMPDDEKRHIVQKVVPTLAQVFERLL